MPTLADELADIRAFQQQRGPRCQAGIALAAMDPKLRATIEQALADPAIERVNIVRWLERRHDILLSLSSFLRHSNGECRCG